jgi:tetratricopeptide (TPR) repeat protein
VLARAEAARSIYEVGRHHALVSTFSQDPGVAARCYCAWSLWNLGWPDRALARAREAVELAHQLADHPFSLAFALTFETILHSLRRDMIAQRERAAELIALTEANGFPMFLGIGRMNHAAARVAAGETGAVAEVLAGIALSAETGSQAGAPGIFAVLAEAYLAAGQLDDARGTVETGLALVEQMGQHDAHVALHNLRGDIVLKAVESQGSSGDREKTAEECFQRAIEIARAQEAKSLELRAALRLARLWRDQGKRAEACELLAPVYGWFTEGFDTQDLIDAKALLAELG